MTEQVQVTRIVSCVPVGDRTRAGKGVSISLQIETGKFLLRMPEAVAATLMEKLQGLKLPLSGLGPIEKLS